MFPDARGFISVYSGNSTVHCCHGDVIGKLSAFPEYLLHLILDVEERELVHFSEALRLTVECEEATQAVRTEMMIKF